MVKYRESGSEKVCLEEAGGSVELFAVSQICKKYLTNSNDDTCMMTFSRNVWLATANW